MSFKQATTDLVCTALEKQMDFLILRGVDDFAREDGDIDVLVPIGCSQQAALCVGRRAFDAGWTIAGVLDIGYLTQICLVKRWGKDRVHHAVKIDFFNGMTWGASGQDPLGRALFNGLNGTFSVAEAIGLATLIQKMLYAGYLRERDRARITAHCTPAQIKSFIDSTGLPLSRADLERGRLSLQTKWRMRAASAGVGLAGMLAWSVRVMWAKIHFTFVTSNILGCILRVKGASGPRHAAIISRLHSILESTGFPRPSSLPDTYAGRVTMIWRRFRGDTVVLQNAFYQPMQACAASKFHILEVQIPKSSANTGDDIEWLLIALSQHILETLNEKVRS